MGKERVAEVIEIIRGIGKFKEKIGVEKVILFGSYARGDFKKYSDVDLILIGKKFKGKNFIKRYKGLWLKWDLDKPVDFICYSPEEFEKERKRVSIVSTALKEGIVI
ncbi:MAG: nucleotidyltransferase domain-containing protein [Candidatus Aenigmarchaeota archaeon]|nr:nucleotidyltransferase domain-containing protein [Candidatus Aenigmarchaeota archaeon]